MPTESISKGGPAGIRRRSQRVILTLAVTVRTVDAASQASFSEETQTLVVNVHGALVLLSGRVTKGQKLLLTNRATMAEQECRVASIGTQSAGKTQVGVEFLQPSPDFWRISFPPSDWVVPDASPVSSGKP
jgi:hypothetical protein